MRVIGSPQVSPPSVDLLTSMAFLPLPPGRPGGASMSSTRLKKYTCPLGENVTQGSVARLKSPPFATVPPEQSVIFGTTTVLHVKPPSKLAPATRPRDPPLDQRYCCQPPTRFRRLAGFAAIHGSTSLWRKTVPGCPDTLSAVHVANGLRPDTFTSESAMKVGGSAHTTVRPMATTPRR